MQEALSANAFRLLRRLVAAETGNRGRVVEDVELFGGYSGLDYDEYAAASRELVEKGFAENPSGGSDYPSLRATPKGRSMFSEI